MIKVLKTARPNGWGWRIVQWPDDYAFFIEEEINEENGYSHWEEYNDYSTLEEAEAAFASLVAESASKPNLAMQAQYDEEHGTVNGYAPWQLNQEC